MVVCCMQSAGRADCMEMEEVLVVAAGLGDIMIYMYTPHTSTCSHTFLARYLDNTVTLHNSVKMLDEESQQVGIAI